MNFLQLMWAMVIFAFYTDPDESPMWVQMDHMFGGDIKSPFLFFATTRPIDNPDQLLQLEEYGWMKVIDPKHEWQGSLFRHVGR